MMIPKFVKREGHLVSEAIVSGGFIHIQGDFSFSAAHPLDTIVVVNPADHTGHLQTADFYISAPQDMVDLIGKAGIQRLFDSWERKDSMNFGSWQEEYGFLLMLALEGVSNLRAWSKSSDYGFEGTGRGVLDANAGSAALVVSGKGNIVVYGSDAAMETLSGVISRWEAMDRPGLLDFQVRIYPLDYSVVLEPDAWLIQKPSAQIVLSSVSQ